jgi:putative addiction module component (TIGR02574 family)
MTLSTKRFCHRRSKKEPQQYKFERAKFADDRKDEGPFTHASPRYGTFSYATACGSRKLNPAVHGELRVNRFRSRATITAHSATHELGDGHRSCARFLMRCSNDREGRAIAHDQSQRRAATVSPHASPEEEISASYPRLYGCMTIYLSMRQPALPPPGFDELSPDEKLEYIQALWDHFSQHPEDVPVPDWHRQVVAERLATHRRGEMTSRPWSEVREELLARLRTER